jgi:predicted TPR repeat methyltransferase
LRPDHSLILPFSANGEGQAPGGAQNPLDEVQSLLDQGRPQAAANILRTLIGSGRGGLLTRLLFTRSLIMTGDIPTALETARDTSSLYAGAAQAALSLGEALLAAQLLPGAIAEFQRALRIDRALDEARVRLVEAWLEAGEPDKALEILQEVKTNPAYATLSERADAMRARQRCDPGYVRHLFDQFSADYDARMRGQLAYAAPEILRALAEFLGLHLARHDILDLGCGTGLAGAAFRDIAARLDGIDLSPLMIEQARQRGIYNDLKIADLEAALEDTPDRYSLIVAADTFVYLGDLADVFEAAARALHMDGTFLFTVEKGACDFELGPKRRWRHSEAYLRKLAAKHGYEVAGLLAASPRTEAGKPVAGLAVALRKIS